jgi:hypothetical protein
MNSRGGKDGSRRPPSGPNEKPAPPKRGAIFPWLNRTFLKQVVLIAVIILAAVGVEVATVSGIVFFGNSEYFERGYQSIVVSEPNTEGPVVVRLVIHKVVPDENSVEASVVIEAPENFTESFPRNPQPCMTLLVDDRSHERLFEPRRFHFDCAKESGEAFVFRQTPRFLLPAWQSVKLYPFDKVETLPLLRLTAGGDMPPTRYVVAKTMSGRVLSREGSDLNWEIILARSTNQKIAILIAATLFIAIALVAAWKIVSAKSATSGLEDVIAVAGFVLAAAGFRSLLGVERLAGTSAFEIAVFLLPLVLLVVGMLIAHVRNATAPRSQRQTGER